LTTIKIGFNMEANTFSGRIYFQMKAVIWALVGLFAGLWLTERRHSEAIKKIYQNTATSAPHQTPQERKSRTPYEISPLFKEHEAQKRRLFHIGGSNIAPYIHQLTGELIQPNMTELEAKLVQEEISWMMRDLTMYESEHKAYTKKRQDKWLDEMGERDNDEA
jgi:hypothetical protein